MKKIRVVLFVLGAFFICCGFKGCFTTDSSNQGFTIETTDKLVAYPGAPDGLSIPSPHNFVAGDFVQGDQFTKGSVTGYTGGTNTNGEYYVNDAKAEAWWDHAVYFYTCVGEPQPGVITEGPGHYSVQNVMMYNQSKFTWECQIPPSSLPQASTRFSLQDNTPSTLTLYASGNTLTSSDGMPLLYVYGQTPGDQPSLINSVTALSVSPDGTSATFPFPHKSDGSSLEPSVYGLALVNSSAANGLSHVGTNFLSMGTHSSFVSPFGVAAGSEQWITTTSITQDPYNDGTCAGQNQTTTTSGSNNYPIVTLYSQNALSIDGYNISVGSNPTAVVIYAWINSDDYEPNGPCAYTDTISSQPSKALVSNSGSNTLSVIDLLYDVVSSTVQVGHNPTAIAVASDGSAAYVTNTGDGTVSRVDLSSLTQTSNVAVGPQPQAIDIASDGTIWVAGAGYLAHLNSNMQMLGNYGTNGDVITSVKYNPSSNEIVATAADSSGNLYIHEVNATSTINSGQYSLNASRLVSTLPRIHGGGGGMSAQFAYAMVSQDAQNPLQTAAAALNGAMTRDGWLTISATTYGFIVTDTVNHVEMMSGSTPGAVTSIAIDPNEQVAYLAVPDSNEVIKVILPTN